MSRGYELRLQDILDAIDKIKRYTDGLDFAQFEVNSMVVDSVNMNLSIIGEAVRNLPVSLQMQYPQVDWRNIAGLRNIITHEYFRLNLARIWDVIENELPKLASQIKQILEDKTNQANSEGETNGEE